MTQKKLEFYLDPELKIRFLQIAKALERNDVNASQLEVVRSNHSTARVYARIWGLPRIFQEAFGINARYVLEVNNKYFNKISLHEQNKVLIHELMHIPKSFSGALLPHHSRHQKINDKTVSKLLAFMNTKTTQ